MSDLLKEINTAVGEVKKSTETLLGDYDRLSKDTKQAMEEFTKAKNRLDSIEDVTRSLQRVQISLRQEQRTAWGDPARRIAHDEHKRAIVQLNILRGLGLMDQLNTKTRDRLNGVMKDLDTGATPGSTYIGNAELEADIYDLLATYGAWRNLDARSIGAKTTEIRLKTARAAAVFVDEAAAIGADATKAGSKVSVTPKKIACLLSASSELLEDDVTGVVTDILNDMTEATSYRIDWISFAANGDADDVDGGFTGLFEGGTARTAASGNVSVATLDYEDVLACLVNAPTAVLQRGNAKWFINPTILAKLLYIKDGNGRPIFNTAIEAPSYGSIGTILGFPVVPVAAAPSTDGTSKLVAAFGDPMGQGVRIRRDITFDRSEHYAFNTDELTFRSTARVASKTKIATAFQVLKTAAS